MKMMCFDFSTLFFCYITLTAKGEHMAKAKLFIGFRNGKVLAMVFTTAQDYTNAIDCDRVTEAGEGTEKQQLEEWLKSLQ